MCKKQIIPNIIKKKQVETCAAKLERAEKLMKGLGGEKDRWKETAEQLTIDYDNVVGDVLVSSGALSYLGAFTGSYRTKIRKQWQNKLTVFFSNFKPFRPNMNTIIIITSVFKQV